MRDASCLKGITRTVWVPSVYGYKRVWIVTFKSLCSLVHVGSFLDHYYDRLETTFFCRNSCVFLVCVYCVILLSPGQRKRLHGLREMSRLETECAHRKSLPQCCRATLRQKHIHLRML